MKVGMIGLGKLGLPVAIAIDMHNHDVMGYDINPDVMQKNKCFYKEAGPNNEESIEPFLQKSNLRFGSISEVVNHSEIIFLAVQTPHEERYEGITPLPYERVDFNYEYLLKAFKSVSDEALKQKKEIVVVVISTVLPGTFRNKIVPLSNKYIKLCYNPFFIAMGTTMPDYLNPEFVLFGVWDNDAANKAELFYKSIHKKPFYKTAVENAELIKVTYNTFIGMKIAFANTVMEICHNTPGSNVDEVTNALKMATHRLISPRYLTAGMGDGGGCHPRDNIALSWLAKEKNLSYDFFESMMLARENQSLWLVDLMCEHKLPKVILGKAFKPETHITLGSPSILCQNFLNKRGHDVIVYDPYVDNEKPNFVKSVFLIGTKHNIFKEFNFPEGSVVIDPWRYIPDNDKINLIRVGDRSKEA